MSARFLDDAARAGFARAIATLEATGGLEVVVAVRRRAGSYLHVGVLVGLACALATEAAMLFGPEPFRLSAILIDPLVVGVGAGVVARKIPALQRLATPRGVRRRWVRAAARAAFVERGVHHTRDRTGVLLFVAWLEREAALVADAGLSQALPPDELARCEAQLAATIRAGGAAVAEALERTLAPIARRVPRRADDVNELPDAIDGDLGAAR